MHFAILRGNNALWTPLLKTVHFVKKNFVDNEYGGWYTSREANASPLSQNVDTDKGSAWKVDYHIVGMCMEAIRLQRMCSKQ